MKTHRTVRWCATGTLVAMAALVATVPLNMGGCGGGGGGPSLDFSGVTKGLNVGGVDVGQAGKGLQQMGGALALSPHDENAVGQEVSLALTNKYGVVNDEKLTRYVILVGSTVAYKSPMSRHWVFGVLNTDEVNAFSSPGKYVFVTRGAIQQMQDESELACVLAHEIGHVNRHHGLDIIKQANFAQGFNTAAQSYSRVSQYAPVADGFVKFLTENAWSAPQEFEADAFGVKYAIAAGYDPDGLLNFLQRVRQKQKAGLKLMSTHPNIDDRIRRITDQISASGAGGRGAVMKERFEQNTGKHQSA